MTTAPQYQTTYIDIIGLIAGLSSVCVCVRKRARDHQLMLHFIFTEYQNKRDNIDWDVIEKYFAHIFFPFSRQCSAMSLFPTQNSVYASLSLSILPKQIFSVCLCLPLQHGSGIPHSLWYIHLFGSFFFNLQCLQWRWYNVYAIRTFQWICHADQIPRE